MNHLTAIVGIVLITGASVAALGVTDRHYTELAAQRHNSHLLAFMQGGMSAIESRCVLETAHPADIKLCVKASMPTKGIEL